MREGDPLEPWMDDYHGINKGDDELMTIEIGITEPERKRYSTLWSLAKSYEFDGPFQAAMYIYESRVNGAHKQARRLFQDLDRQNKQECIEILRENVGDPEAIEAVTDWLHFDD